MILSVSHVTTYRYEAPLRGSVQSLRMTPTRFDGQRTIRWSQEVRGGERGAGFMDGSGDWLESWSLRGPVDTIEVAVEGQVETTDLNGVLRGLRESVPPLCYLRDTAPARADAALTYLANDAGDPSDALATAHRLATIVADNIAYRPGVTEAHTTAAEALALGQGVCQDHAHALIAMARVLGVPARYVSGYLHADADGHSHEAAHAWAEIWVDGLGWVGFDAANRCCPDERYIRIGSGFDAQDAAPIRGIAQGPGLETLDVTVAVAAVQQ
jgi:transglutaminase-like putative cysteine protease